MAAIEIKEQIDNDINRLSLFNGLIAEIKIQIEGEDWSGNGISPYLEKLFSIQYSLDKKKAIQDIFFDVDENEFNKLMNYAELKIEKLIKELYSRINILKNIKKWDHELVIITKENFIWNCPEKELLYIQNNLEGRKSEDQMTYSQDEQRIYIENLSDEKIPDYLLCYIEHQFIKYKDSIQIEKDNCNKISERTSIIDEINPNQNIKIRTLLIFLDEIGIIDYLIEKYPNALYNDYRVAEVIGQIIQIDNTKLESLRGEYNKLKSDKKNNKHIFRNEKLMNSVKKVLFDHNLMRP